MKEYQWLRALLLCLIWNLLSYGQVFKLLGPTRGMVGCLAFDVVMAATFFIAQRQNVSQRSKAVPRALAGVWLFVAAAYFVLHPLSVRHTFGPGSDRENAIEVASHALFHGHFPYRELTFLHHPITPMPGALLLASPFYAIGQVGLQNLLWLAVFLWWIHRFIATGWLKVWYASAFMALSPCIMQDVVTGGEFFTNFVYVLVLLTAVFVAIRRNPSGWLAWLLPLLLGVALASRSIYSLVYPCLFFFVLQSSRWVVAVRSVLLSLAAELAVILPVYLRDPPHFMPLNVGSNAYSLLPSWLHPAVFVFASGIVIASISSLVKLDIRRVCLILGLALTVVTLPLFVMDRMIRPDLFPLINLIYLSPGLLLIALWFLPVNQEIEGGFAG